MVWTEDVKHPMMICPDLIEPQMKNWGKKSGTIFFTASLHFYILINNYFCFKSFSSLVFLCFHIFILFFLWNIPIYLKSCYLLILNHCTNICYRLPCSWHWVRWGSKQWTQRHGLCPLEIFSLVGNTQGRKLVNSATSIVIGGLYVASEAGRKGMWSQHSYEGKQWPVWELKGK